MALSVAIIGAGPSGFYAARALTKLTIDCHIDIIECLPTPFGLVRFGVAPDHEHTKRVTRSYERTAEKPYVSYFGNVEVGRDVSLAELREIYDAVVLATGAPLDRRLDIEGSELPGVHGSAEFVGWYNAHPDHRDLAPRLENTVAALIGNGNVALDVARILAKTPEEMAPTDLPDYAAERLHSSPIRDIYIFGRRGPLEAKWTNVDLREIGHLKDCHPLLDSAQLPDTAQFPDEIEGTMSERARRLAQKNLATLKSFRELTQGGKSKRLHFVFCAKPDAVLGTDRVEGLRLERTRIEGEQAVGIGEFFEVPCGLIVSSIGYRSKPLEGAPFDERRGVFANQQGRIATGLYVVGWAMRGPTGVIGSNKPDADLVAGAIAEDLTPGDKAGRPALESLLAERGIRPVSFQDWKRIEAAEIQAAAPQAPRKKLIRIEDMLAVLGEAPDAGGA